MNPVILRAQVRRRIGAAGLSRTGMLRLVSWLYDELEHRAHHHSHNRAPGRPGHFQVRKNLLDGGVIHKFVFAVDDTQPGVLIVDQCRRGT